MQATRGFLGARAMRFGASCLAIAASLAVGATVTSCGGSGKGAAKPMVLVSFQLVDRALNPSFPTGVQALPRNAQIIFQFSELVDPTSVNDQTIAIRYGPQFQSIPKGAFQVDGSRVIFDPTVTRQGTPNPFGLDPVTQYNVELPAVGDVGGTIENLDNDPLLTSFFTNFVTSDGYLRELVAPTLESISFIPERDPFTQEVPGNALLVLKFSEPMDPATFQLAGGASITPSDGVDVRWADLSPDPNVNFTAGVENTPIPGSFTHDASAKTYYFKPLFSYGSGGLKLIFTVSVFQALKDLSGNSLVNPRSEGPFKTNGQGTATGKILNESFDTVVNADTAKSDADWSGTVQGQLQGAAVTTRRVWIAGFQEVTNRSQGQYNPIIDPLIGAAINQYITNLSPPSDQGRRVMWAFDDLELGAAGTVTAAAWGPDSNATFAATYPEVILRIGYQKSASLSLSSSFSANYGASPLIFYKGAYNVSQKANVGNEYPLPNGGMSPVFGNGCAQPAPSNGDLDCLFAFGGYVNWPTPSSFFDWVPGDAAVDHDAVLLFDASVNEGDTWQQLRGWFGVTAPNSGVLIGGYPERRMYATFEEDTPNPPPSFAAGRLNPEPSITDTAFTITKRVSIAQSRFYTPLAGGAGGPYPGPYSAAPANTFGTKSDYSAMVISPSVQAGGATYLVEYEGADVLDAASARTAINVSFFTTGWVTNVNVCDGHPYLRWRITLVANLISNQVPKMANVLIPITQLP